VFFSLDGWGEKSRPPPPDLLRVIRESELELPDEGNKNECILMILKERSEL